MRKLLFILFIGAIVYQCSEGNGAFSGLSSHEFQVDSSNTRALERSYKNRLSDVQVSGEGVVIKLLRDDNEGSRHQKFIVRLPSGQTLLIAHNIDVAPRVNSISTGDKIQFKGEYEWNNKGGVVHWTHHDPAGQHVDGWLKHRGVSYE